MDIVKIHSRYKDKDSPTVKGQVQWLEKQGFSVRDIERGMQLAYGEIDSGRSPICWERNGEASPKRPPKIFTTAGGKPPDQWYSRRDIQGGRELDKFVLATVKRVQAKHHGLMIGLIQELDKERRKQWARELPWWKRLIGARK